MQADSSPESTPRKKQTNVPAAERGTTSPSYALDASGRDEVVSEGEVTSFVTIQDILAKLDSVKVHTSYLDAT